MSTLVFDIETGPLPWPEIAPFYEPPEHLPPWDDGMVKYGQMKDPAKRAEKYAEVKRIYMDKLNCEARDLEEHRAKWASEAALSPVTGCILAIGLRREDRSAIIGADGETEPEILEAFWKTFRRYNASNGRLVGYCSNLFDFGFIVWRSYKHQVEVPSSAWDKSGRYPCYTFVDLIDRLPKRGFEETRRGLGHVCRWLGLGDKPEGIDGGMFASLWRAGTDDSRGAALAYLENDLEMTWRLAERMGAIV